MAELVICNVCQKPIHDQAQAKKDRIYVVLATGHPLPPQKKHDACDEVYAKDRVGLRKST